MDAADLLPHRPALIGAAIALVVGVAGGLVLRTGSQAAPQMDSYVVANGQETQAEPIAWPSGKIADYVIGTDFTRPRPLEQPPVVVASYDVPEYTPTAWSEPPAEPAPDIQRQTVRNDQSEPAWPSTHGDILDIRLPEDVARAPEPPPVVAAPVAVAALDAPN